MTGRIAIDVTAAVRALKEMTSPGAAERAGIGPATAGESLGEPPPLDLARARRAGDLFQGLMRVQQAAAGAIADEAFEGITAPDDPLEAELWQALLSLNRALLAHPLATRAACDALRAEGRRHAKTPEGAALRERLAGAPAVARAGVAWRSVTMGAFAAEPDPEAPLPSAWLDVFSRLAGWDHLERVLGRLTGQTP